MVNDRSPMKRGLKGSPACCFKRPNSCERPIPDEEGTERHGFATPRYSIKVQVNDRSPMKRGLKAEIDTKRLSQPNVNDRSPMKRGLKDATETGNWKLEIGSE